MLPIGLSKFSAPFRLNESRKNATFSKERMREIDVENHFLLRRIMKHQTPPQSAGPKRTAKPSNYFNHDYVQNAGKRTSSAINRKKQQSKIDYENGVSDA
jgi:Hemingway/CFA97